MPKKQLTPEALTVAVKAFATGTATRRTLQASGIPQRHYPQLAMTAQEELELFRTELSGELRGILRKLTKRLHDESEKISTAQLPVAIGILTDKHRDLHSGASAAQSLHLHLHGADRDEAMARLLGAGHARPVKRAEVVL